MLRPRLVFSQFLGGIWRFGERLGNNRFGLPVRFLGPSHSEGRSGKQEGRQQQDGEARQGSETHCPILYILISSSAGSPTIVTFVTHYVLCVSTIPIGKSN